MPTNYQPKRAQKRPRRRNPIPLLAAAAAVCLALIIIPSLGSGPAQSAEASRIVAMSFCEPRSWV